MILFGHQQRSPSECWRLFALPDTLHKQTCVTTIQGMPDICLQLYEDRDHSAISYTQR
jgi:hypothetical protein